MGLFLKPTPISVLSYTLIFLLCFGVFVSKNANSISDYSTLVFKDCAAQTFTVSSGDSHSQTLPSLFQELVAHSSQTKFFKTTAGDEQLGISGLFQCRGDLSNTECYSCVNTLFEISNSLCNNAVAARIQLLGCYVFYETDGFSNPRENELLYKTCDKSEAAASGFVDSREAAFAALESGVVSSDIGFYAESYESLHVMGQCEGDLGNCDCGECVSNAVQISKEVCGGSISGQIYIDNCFMSYTYYPKGIPDDTNSEKKKTDSSRGKAIAIVVGGAAALCFGFVFLLFIKSWGKMDDE